MYEGSAIAFISKDNKILLHDRKSEGVSRWGERWGLIGGERLKGESAEETLIRETEEELGITLNDYKYIGDYHSPKANLLVHLYVAPISEFHKSTYSGEIKNKKRLSLFSLSEAKTQPMLGLGSEIYSDLDSLGYLK